MFDFLKLKKPKLIELSCKECGKLFSVKKNSTVFCSKSCYKADRKKVNSELKYKSTCMNCNIEFFGRVKDQKFCKKSCSNRIRSKVFNSPCTSVEEYAYLFDNNGGFKRWRKANMRKEDDGRPFIYKG